LGTDTRCDLGQHGFGDEPRKKIIGFLGKKANLWNRNPRSTILRPFGIGWISATSYIRTLRDRFRDLAVCRMAYFVNPASCRAGSGTAGQDWRTRLGGLQSYIGSSIFFQSLPQVDGQTRIGFYYGFVRTEGFRDLGCLRWSSEISETVISGGTIFFLLNESGGRKITYEGTGGTGYRTQLPEKHPGNGTFYKLGTCESAVHQVES